MIETIVAVVGAFSTLAGVGVGVAGYRSQAAQLRLQAAQLERQIAEAERARLLAVAAEQRAASAEERAAQDAQRQIDREERADRRRQRLALIEHARGLTVVPGDGNNVRVVYSGRLPVTDVRIFWWTSEITPDGQSIDLHYPPGVRESNGTGVTVLAPVPGLPEGTRVRLSDIHVDFTDVHGRRWRRRGNGALLQQVDNDHWDPAPTAWLDEAEGNTPPEYQAYPYPQPQPQPQPQSQSPWTAAGDESPLPAPSGAYPQPQPQSQSPWTAAGDEWPLPAPSGAYPQPQPRPWFVPAEQRPRPQSGPKPETVAGRLRTRRRPEPVVQRRPQEKDDTRSATLWTRRPGPILALALLGIGIACLTYLAL
ncbi:hypothetical protein [Kitasatospora sp. NPDC050543]|uniref:hypothetical protein n=1 Tax=Kitasatospora sp. NPDC050543 TaxID=3364054 RepID=UPI0037B2B381